MLAGPSAHALVPAASGPAVSVHQTQFLVRFRPRTPAVVRRALLARAGAHVVRRIDAINYDVVRAPETATAILQAARAVAVVEPNYPGSIALAPGDTCLNDCDGIPGQWHLGMINASEGWDAVPGRTFTAAAKRVEEAVTIAVLDTKIDTSHPDFANPGGSADAADGGQLDLTGARDWVPSSRWKGSAAYHGTFVAGLAGAAAGNSTGTAGVGYAARLLPLTVVDGGGTTDAATLADAIVYAWRQGARVINLSLGIAGDSSAVHDAIRLATSGTAQHAPALVVAAAGNNTSDTPFFPGSYPEVMSVAGTNRDDQRASCSNYNSNVSVAAPADRLVGLMPQPAERGQAPCGTSAAAPQVSGLAALLFTQDPSRTPKQVRTLIEGAADDLGAPGRDPHFGFGRINVGRSLRATGPVTTGARATVAAGSTSIVTAVALSARGVRAARVMFDRPGATPVAVQAADGAFGGTTENLRATLPVPAGTPGGAHPAWISAFDGTTWGPSAATVVIVDTRAPTVSQVTASDGLRAAGRPLSITFTAIDDYATSLTYGIEFRSTVTGKIMHRAVRSVPAGTRRYDWLPGLDAPAGHYLVKIGVADPSGNAAFAETGAVLS